MDIEHYLIPRHLDAPPMFLIFEADTAAIFLGCLFFGLMFQAVLVFAPIGLVLARAYARLKAEGGRGIFVQTMYWYTPSKLWLRRTPPSWIREYIG